MRRRRKDEETEEEDETESDVQSSSSSSSTGGVVPAKQLINMWLGGDGDEEADSQELNDIFAQLETDDLEMGQDNQEIAPFI